MTKRTVKMPDLPTQTVPDSYLIEGGRRAVRASRGPVKLERLLISMLKHAHDKSGLLAKNIALEATRAQLARCLSAVYEPQPETL